MFDQRISTKQPHLEVFSRCSIISINFANFFASASTKRRQNIKNKYYFNYKCDFKCFITKWNYKYSPFEYTIVFPKRGSSLSPWGRKLWLSSTVFFVLKAILRERNLIIFFPSIPVVFLYYRFDSELVRSY